MPNAEFREDQDILLSGFVSWLGKSSMEVPSFLEDLLFLETFFTSSDYWVQVTITAKQQDSSTPDGFRDLLVSRFIMVSVTPDFKGAPNVPLKLYTDDQRKMFDEGEGFFFICENTKVREPEKGRGRAKEKWKNAIVTLKTALNENRKT